MSTSAPLTCKNSRLLAVVILNAPSARRALLDASQYLFLHSPAYEVVVDDVSPLGPAYATTRFGVRLEVFSPQRQLIDGCLAVTHELVKLVIPEHIRLAAVTLPHTPVASMRVYRDYFGVPIHFGQPYAGLHVDRRLLELDLRAMRPALRATALHHIRSSYRPRRDTTADLVRHTLTRTMGMNRGTKSEVAELISMHPRTLQRRLDALGTTFESIRDEVYRQRALHYLTETNIPLAQVAAALGYSEHSALTRACDRWFDRTPSAMRRDAPESSAAAGSTKAPVR